MSHEEVTERLRKLVDEGQGIRALNDGSAHNNPAFKAWRQRSQSAIEDKLGPDSRAAKELSDLTFFAYHMIWTESTPPISATEHQRAFSDALDDALALLIAALEANPRPVNNAHSRDAPLVHIEQVGNKAQATASVQVDVTLQQLRQLVASEPGLTPEERSDAMASLPDDPDDLTIEKVDKLLDVALKAKGLFAPLLGWLLTHADKIHWPTQ